MSFKDDLKSMIVESGFTITQVVAEINRINGTYTSVQNFSSKMIRETFKYTEVEQIMEIIGYRIHFTPIQPIYTQAQYTQQIGRGTRMAETILEDIGDTPISALGVGAVGHSKNIITLISQIVDKEFNKRYLEQTNKNNKISDDFIKKELLRIHKENNDKKGD